MNKTLLTTLVVGALGFTASTSFSQTTGTWNVDANGNWSALGSWTGLTGGVVPNAIDANVTFGTIITAGRTVTLDTNVAVGSLTFNEDGVTANSYAISFNNASRTMTFDVSSGDATVAARGLGGYQLGTQGTGQVVLNDNLSISAGSNGASTADGGNFNINSQIIDGNAGSKGLILSSLISNDGSGTLTSGFRGTYLRSTVANTFSGGVIVNSGYLGLSGNIGNAGSGSITLNASESASGIGTTLTLKTGGGTLANNLIFGNSGATGGGSPRLAISLGDSSAQNYVHSGTISGAIGNQQIRFSAAGNVASSLTLSGDGSGLTSGTSGSFHVRSGILRLNHANAFATGNTLGNGTTGGWSLGNFSNGATGSSQLLTNGFNVGGAITTQQTTTAAQSSPDNIVLGGYHTTGSATFSGNITVGRIVAGSRQFQLTSAAGGTTVFSGAIADGSVSGSAATVVPIVKVGDGVVNLTRAAGNTYTGGTTVSTGTLLVNNSTGSGTGTGTVTVASTGTLGGAGFIAGDTTINGTLAAGNSPGLLTFNDAGAGVTDLTLTGTANSLFEINGATRGTLYDAVDVEGILTMAGTLTLDFGYTPAVNDPFTLFNAGTFAGNFSTVTFLDAGFAGSFNATTGVLTMTAVPEPSAWLLLTGGLTALTLFRRRRF